MPSYAVLGSTGNTGKALLQVLLRSPKNEVKAYCRSQSKLLQQVPAAQDNKHLNVFEGQLDDVGLVADCIRDTRAVFMAVAIVDNMPRCTIARDTAKVVVVALERLKAESPTTTPPKLIVLSSASLEDSFCGDVPAFVHTVLTTAVSNLYRDLREAEEYLRAQSSWISTTFIKPGGLVKDQQKGHQLSTTTAKTPLSFLDLAAGMIEVADNETDEYRLKNVSVLPTTDDVIFPWDGVYFVFTGLCFHFFPWTYRFLGEYQLPASANGK